MNEKMTKIMLIIMGVILAILLGLTGFLVLNLNSKQPAQTSQTSSADTQKKLENSVFVSLGDAFTSNCKQDPNSSSENFVKFSASICVDKTDTAINKIVSDRSVEIRDEIYKIVRNMTYKELSQPDIQNILSDKIVKDLSKLYNTTKIYKVRFSDILTQ